MNEILILSSARKAILARLSSLGRRFCNDDINEMVSMTVERFYTRGSYDASKASVQTYVSRIARNAAYDFVNASDKGRERFTRLDAILDKSRDEDMPLNADPVWNLWFRDSCEADSFLLAEERKARLERAKNKLSLRFREYFDLCSQGYSYEEIAGLMGSTVNNVSVVMHRMRKQFMTLYEEVA